MELKEYRKKEKEKPTTSFSMNTLNSIDTISGRMRYVDKYFKKMSTGSSRMVYGFNKDVVLKLAWNRKGLAQNKFESSLYLNKNYRFILASVYKAHPKGYYNLQQKAKPLNKQVFKSIFGIPFYLYANYFNYLDIKKNGDAGYTEDELDYINNLMTSDGIKKVAGNWFFKKVYEFAKLTDLLLGDLADQESYGIVTGSDGKNKIVLVDYGISNKVYQDVYIS